MRRHASLVLVALAACGKGGSPAPTAAPAPAPTAASAPATTVAAPAPAPAPTAAPAPAPTAAPAPAPTAAPAPAPTVAATAPETIFEASEKPLVLTEARALGSAPRPAPVEGVPPLVFSGQGPSAQSRRANLAGLERHRMKDWAAAASHFVDALTYSPDNVVARYNLACASARAGDLARAKGLLAELLAGGCQPCLEAVAGSGRDKDLEALAADPDVKRLQAEARSLARRGGYTPGVASLDEGGTRVVWRTHGAPLAAGHGLTLSWAAPAQIVGVRTKFESLGATVALTMSGQPTQSLSLTYGNEEGPAIEEHRLDTPLVGTSVVVLITGTVGGDPVADRIELELFAVQPPGAAPAPPVEPAAEGAEATALGADDDGDVTFTGMPAISADGQRIVFMETDEDNGGALRTLQIVEVGKHKPLVAIDLKPRTEEEYERFTDALAKKRLTAARAQLDKHGPWTPMLSVGGDDGWDSHDGSVSQVYASFDGVNLAVGALDGSLSLFARPDWPRPETEWERDARLNPVEPEPRAEEDPDAPVEMVETFSVRWNGAFIDAARTALFVPIFHKYGVCAGGGVYDYRTLRL